MFICKHCGREFKDIKILVTQGCIRHPDGAFKGKHELYEGGKKEKYMCKYCGRYFKDFSQLTIQKCLRHPNGAFKGKHEAAL